MANAKKVAPKAAQKKMLAAAVAAVKAQEPVEADPAYIALRLRGLARLVLCASGSNGHADPIDNEAGFFIATELEAMAFGLGYTNSVEIWGPQKQSTYQHKPHHQHVRA